MSDEPELPAPDALPIPPKGFPGGYVPIIGRVVDDQVVPLRPEDSEALPIQRR